MKGQGIVLLGRDQMIESRAQRHGLQVNLGQAPALLFDKTLIVTPGARIPWDLLPAAWKFLDRWDAAIPLWRYDVTAASQGTEHERKITKAVIRDLRVLLYAYELLFVRNNAPGRALVDTWIQEMDRGDNKRLAFLRAFYQVKPQLCVLPTSWLRETQTAVLHAPARKMSRPQITQLVKVEIGKGRFVKCRVGDEGEVLKMQAAQSRRMAPARRVIAMPIVNRQSFTIENQKTRNQKGPLVRVEISPGRFGKMYQQDAIAQGLIKAPKPKGKPAQQDKARPAQEDKGRPAKQDKEKQGQAIPAAAADIAKTGEAAADSPPAPVDDFTKIAGVGKATARQLALHQVTTFDQLKTADLSYLSDKPRQAIDAWLAGSEG